MLYCLTVIAAVPPVPPAGGLPGAPAPGHCSYHNFYTDASNDPYLGQYLTIAAEFSIPTVPSAAIVTPQELVTQVYALAQQGTPNAFLLMCHSPMNPQAEPKVTLFHKVAQFGAHQGLPCKWDDMAFAFKGDVSGQETIMSVVWQTNYFNQSNQLWVATQAVYDQALTGDPNLTMVRPYDTADAGTEVHHVQCCCYIPPKYIGLFLEQDLSLHEACERATTSHCG